MTKSELQTKVCVYEKALEKIAKLEMPQNDPNYTKWTGRIARNIAREALHEIDPHWFATH